MFAEKFQRKAVIMTLSRRTILAAMPWLAAVAATPTFAEGDASIHVVKDPGCPCCNGWIGHLRDNGFRVTFEERSIEDLEAFKRERGIPEDLASCHTATIGDYTVEGHVPAADIRRLLAERPVAVGLSVPGMPYGSPGMDPRPSAKPMTSSLSGWTAAAAYSRAIPPPDRRRACENADCGGRPLLRGYQGRPDSVDAQAFSSAARGDTPSRRSDGRIQASRRVIGRCRHHTGRRAIGASVACDKTGRLVFAVPFLRQHGLQQDGAG